jgi:hypothetical protein
VTASGDISERLTIEELVLEYEAAETAIRVGFSTVQAALDRLNAIVAMNGNAVRIRDRHHRGQSIDFDNADFHVREIRRDVWRALVERMQLRQGMSIAAWEKLDSDLEKGDPAPINAETVRGVVAGFRSDLPEMLKDAVKEVFNWLRPPGSGYKTNTEFELGERVVLTYMLEAPSYGGWQVNYRHGQHLIALENVFAMMDGKLPATSEKYFGELGSAIRDCQRGAPCVGATDLFSFKGFKNGNLHLKFLRMDLVKKLNAVAGGARLKPTGQ